MEPATAAETAWFAVFHSAMNTEQRIGINSALRIIDVHRFPQVRAKPEGGAGCFLRVVVGIRQASFGVDHRQIC
jgi:hypothetical protein